MSHVTRYTSPFTRHTLQAAELHKKLSQRLMKGGGGGGGLDSGDSKGGAVGGGDVKRAQWLQLQVMWGGL